MASASPEILTYQDLIDGLVDINDDDHMSRSSSKLKTGCLEAYRQLLNMNKWEYYKSIQKIHLKAKETFTSEATYVASTRTWTLSTGPWPTWAAHGEIIHGNEIYEVETRTSDTVLISPERNAPDTDISSAVTVDIQRTRYTLPAGFTSMVNPVSTDTWFDWDNYITTGEWLERYKHFTSNASFRAWTIMGDPILYGRMAIAIYPVTDTNETIDFVYTRAPSELTWTGYEDSAYKGAVSGTAGNTALTATNHTLDASHVGAMIRISRDSGLPTGRSGANPYVEQHIITDVTSNTITLATTLETSPSSQKFTVTSVIDVAPYMITAIRRLADYHSGTYLSKTSRKRDYGDVLREVKIAAGVEGGMNASMRRMNPTGSIGANRLRYLRG